MRLRGMTSAISADPILRGAGSGELVLKLMPLSTRIGAVREHHFPGTVPSLAISVAADRSGVAQDDLQHPIELVTIESSARA
jgi:hypothetical protein